MEAEALPMVKSLNLKKDDPSRIPPPAPCVSYSGTDWGMNIHLVCFGTHGWYCYSLIYSRLCLLLWRKDEPNALGSSSIEANLICFTDQ